MASSIMSEKDIIIELGQEHAPGNANRNQIVVKSGKFEKQASDRLRRGAYGFVLVIGTLAFIIVGNIMVCSSVFGGKMSDTHDPEESGVHGMVLRRQGLDDIMSWPSAGFTNLSTIVVPTSATSTDSIPDWGSPIFTNSSGIVAGISATSTLIGTGSVQSNTGVSVILTSAPAIVSQTSTIVTAPPGNSSVSSGTVSAGNVQKSVDGTLTRTSTSNTVTKTHIVTPTRAIIVTAHGDVPTSPATQSSVHLSDQGENCNGTSFITVTKTVSPIEVGKGSVATDTAVTAASPLATKDAQSGGGPTAIPISEAGTVTVTYTRQGTVHITETEYAGATDTANAVLSTHVPSNYATEVVGVEKTVYVTNTAPAVNVSYTVVQYTPTAIPSGTGKSTPINDTVAISIPTLAASATPSEDSTSDGEKSRKGGSKAAVFGNCVFMIVALTYLFL